MDRTRTDLVLEIARLPALPKSTTPWANFSMQGSIGALGTKAFCLCRGSTKQGAAGNTRICLFNC